MILCIIRVVPIPNSDLGHRWDTVRGVAVRQSSPIPECVLQSADHAYRTAVSTPCRRGSGPADWRVLGLRVRSLRSGYTIFKNAEINFEDIGECIQNYHTENNIKFNKG